jgi:hypothetical protein
MIKFKRQCITVIKAIILYTQVAFAQKNLRITNYSNLNKIQKPTLLEWNRTGYQNHFTRSLTSAICLSVFFSS